MKRTALIHDWNEVGAPTLPASVELDDETLRDGLQSPSATQPPIGAKIELLHVMDALGIQIADIGLPGAGGKVALDVEQLAREIAQGRLQIRAACAARTVVADIEPIVDIAARVGVPIEVHTFIGSSPIRRYVEDWDLDRMIRHTEEACRFAVRNGCPVMYVTEDTTRSDPDTLTTLLRAAVAAGASRVALCDTVGHATPNGVRALVRFVRSHVLAGSDHIRIDWHGHSDRGLALANALAAIEAGANRIHATGMGIGERAGNTPMDLLLVNLKLLGLIHQPLGLLKKYCDAVERFCGFPIPPCYPVVGRDAFRTGTGIHAAAIIKSIAKEEDRWLRDQVYSGVPAGEFGFEQVIEIGPMCGRSNVEYWLRRQGLTVTAPLVEAIYERAKRSHSILSDHEMYKVIVEAFVARPNAFGETDTSDGHDVASGV